MTSFSTGIFTELLFFKPRFRLTTSLGFNGLLKSNPHALTTVIFVGHNETGLVLATDLEYGGFILLLFSYRQLLSYRRLGGRMFCDDLSRRCFGTGGVVLPEVLPGKEDRGAPL